MFSIESLSQEFFGWNTALSMALSCQLAYQNGQAVANIAINNWGLQSCRFIENKPTDTQVFVAHAPGAAIVSFRGTENVADWLTNIQLHWTTQSYGKVHSGFLEAFQSVRGEILAELSRHGTANKNIWITGHSLGGALASIAVADFIHEVPVTGCYTFGQPRLGNAEFRDFIQEHYPQRFFRFVNDDDLVTRIPPGYRHVGSLFHFDQDGNLPSEIAEASLEGTELPALTETEFRQLQEQIRGVQAAAANFAMEHEMTMESQQASVEASIEGLIPSVSDHGLSNYIAKIRNFVRSVQVDDVVEMSQRIIEGDLRLESFSLGGELEGVNVTSGKSAERMPVLIRVRNAKWKPPKNLQVNSNLGTIYSAQASSVEINELRTDPNVISIEASRDGGINDCAVSVPFVKAHVVHAPPLMEKGDQSLIGIVDTGIDVLHEAFRDENDLAKSRILAIWNQRDASGPTPKAVDPGRFTQDYGTLYLAADIQGFLNQPHTTPPALRDPDAHGTHVSSIAAGIAVGTFGGGVAPKSRLLAVIPNMSTSPQDPPSVGYSNSHVDGLKFLKQAAEKEGKPMAVNVSLGMNAGSHDGTSTLEAAFDQLTNLGRDAGFVVVKSGGNERGHGGHAKADVAQAAISEITWESENKFRLRDYLEGWYSSFNEFEFTLFDPGGNPSVTVSSANPTVDAVLGGNFCRLKLTKSHADNGDSRLQISILPDTAPIQVGTWKLEVLGVSVNNNGRIDMWVERDRSRAVRFQTGDNNEMTLSVPGTAQTVITVAACHSQLPLRLTNSSSFGPTRDTRPKPDICAPGEQIVAARSGSADTQAVRPDTGTSMAAPHVTGALALALSKRQKSDPSNQLNARQLRAFLIRSSGGFTGLHNPGFGYGVLDVEKFINMV